MSPQRTPPTFRRLTVAALLVAAIGFVVQMISGVTNTPAIPPGLVVIVVAGLLVAFLPGQWTPLAGPAAGLFNLVAFLVVGAADRLFELRPASAFIGAWLMVVALVVCTVAGTIAAVRNEQMQSVAG